MEETEKKQECAGAATVEAETELHRLREELEEAKRAARADRAALKGRLYRELLRGAGVDEKRIGAIAEKKGAKITLSRVPQDIRGGFLLNYGGSLDNCSVEAIFASEADRLKDCVREVLFSEEVTA